LRAETYGLDLLAADLEKSAEDITKKVAKVTGMACNKMKKDAQQSVRGMAHLPHLPRSYTYDVTTRGDVVTGEVGALHERVQGKLDWVAEYGTPTSSPVGQWARAADREIPVWQRYLDEVAAEGLE
jgi:hypothetical protein